MTESMKSRIGFANGLHLRAAGSVARKAEGFQSKIVLRLVDHEANAKSVLSLMGLAAGPGLEVEVSADGPDAKEAVRVLCELLEKGEA